MATPLEILIELGVEASNALDPNNLVVLRKAYVETVDSAKASAEKSESQLKVVSQELAKDKSRVATLEELLSEIRSVILPYIDSDPAISVLLFDSFQDLRDEVKFDREYFLTTGSAFTGVKKPVTSQEYTEKRNRAEQISLAISSLWEMLGRPTNLGADFPVKETTIKKGEKKGEKSGNKVPDLPNLPQDRDGENKALVGRAAAISRLRFKWTPTDGQVIELPEGIRPIDVAYNYVSDRSTGYIISWAAIVDQVKKSGKQVMDGNRWKAKFKTGVLEGWIQK